MTAPSWTLPSPASGAGIPASEAKRQDGGFFSSDIWFDVAAVDANGEANYVITPDGDLTVVTGREALRQSLIRRTITAPGDWATAPEYGVGARTYVKAQNTPAKRAELESRIRAQYLRDKRVLKVDLVTVSQLEDGEGIRISVTVIPRGRLRSDQAMSVKLEIR